MDLNKEDGGNRKYICVQLPEETDEKSEAYKAGYQTIADIAKERIRRAGKKIADEIKAENEEKKAQLDFGQDREEKQMDLGFKVLKLSDSNFKQWRQIEGKDAEALEEQMELFVDPVAENASVENMIYELLLKTGKDLNSEIEQKNGYFCVNTNEIALMLEKATQEIVDAVLKEKPQKVIALDRLFTGNDQLKTNTALQMKDAGIEFKTI
jgi:adenine-specific DNA-methyltransferase